MGYLMLFHEIGLDYTFSTYASEGGNFGLFHSAELAKSLNAKIYAEAERLKVKWVLGGECGHMWLVIHQYMDTVNGPPAFLEEPASSVTGTKFDNAKSTKMVHICEFTADLIHNGKLKLDPGRNDTWKVTYHDSCNPARAMGLFEEPRYIINNTCNQFYEMPENTISSPFQDGRSNACRKRFAASSFTTSLDSKSVPAPNPQYSCEGRA
jgi:Fe-S oxidoreductase